MKGFFGKITWQGVLTGAVGMIVLGKLMGGGR